MHRDSLVCWLEPDKVIGPHRRAVRPSAFNGNSKCNSHCMVVAAVTTYSLNQACVSTALS